MIKKYIFTLSICTILLCMPIIPAIQPSQQTQNIPKPQKTLNPPPINDYDGTFAGGLGQLYRENDEWQFDYYAYVAGVYKLGAYKKLYGYIYDLDEQQIGYIGAIFGFRLIIGNIEDMDNNRAPIIGFLFWDHKNFAGRIMSVAGPATYIIGEYYPNT